MQLRIKIGLLVTAIMGGFVAVLLVLADRRTDEALMKEHGHALAQTAEHIAEEIEQPLEGGALNDLRRRLLEQKARNDEIEYLFVTDGKGNVIAHTFPADVPPELRSAVALERGNNRAFAVLSKGNLFHMAVRIAKGADAELHVGTSEQHHHERVRFIHRQILATGSAVIVAAAVLGFAMGHWLTKPVREVIAGMEIIGRGNLDHRIAVTGNDEAGMLARAFNEMADHRREAEDRIIQLNFELDERVQQRTAQLEAANREMEAFSYSVSHDLRAPLRGIDGFSKALLDDYGDKFDADGRDYLRRVRKASQRMGQLIDDILKLSRLTRGEMYLEQVDLSSLAREVVRTLQDANPERKVKAHIQEGIGGRGDRKMLRVVLENLIGNAWKYTSKQPLAWITFGMAPSQSGTACFVKDNGAGFDMAFSQKLFAPFQRLHAEKDFPGTGIGLATVQRIVHRHGGRIWAESEPGKGATFYFTLGGNSA